MSEQEDDQEAPKPQSDSIRNLEESYHFSSENGSKKDKRNKEDEPEEIQSCEHEPSIQQDEEPAFKKFNTSNVKNVFYDD